MDLNALVIQFSSLVGIAACIAALVQIAKAFGLPNGAAGHLSAMLSLIAFIALAALKLFAPDVDIAGLDKQASDLAVFALYVLGFFVQMGLPSKIYGIWKDASVPFLGYSHTKG